MTANHTIAPDPAAGRRTAEEIVSGLFRSFFYGTMHVADFEAGMRSALSAVEAEHETTAAQLNGAYRALSAETNRADAAEALADERLLKIQNYLGALEEAGDKLSAVEAERDDLAPKLRSVTFLWRDAIRERDALRDRDVDAEALILRLRQLADAANARADAAEARVREDGWQPIGTVPLVDPACPVRGPVVWLASADAQTVAEGWWGGDTELWITGWTDDRPVELPWVPTHWRPWRPTAPPSTDGGSQ